MNTKKRVAVTLDIRTAVNYAEVQMLQDTGAFFVDTDFGRICIESNAFRKTNPTRPVFVCPWAEAPETAFAVDRMNDAADWWAAVDIYDVQLTDHLSIIEVFTRAMFMHLGYTDLEDSIIDAAVYMYVSAYDPFSVNVNLLEREFRKSHLKQMHLHGDKAKSMQAIVRELFIRKIEAAERVYRRSERHINAYMKDNNTTFFDDYCRGLFGIILFANQEQKENARYNYSRLVDLDTEINIDKSVAPLKDMLDQYADNESWGKQNGQ